MFDRNNDPQYILVSQRARHIEQTSREAWKYQELDQEQGPGLRARLAARLLALATWLAPEARQRPVVADAAKA